MLRLEGVRPWRSLGIPLSEFFKIGVGMDMTRDSSTREFVLVRQVRSTSGRTKEVVRTIGALGLRGIGSSRVVRVNLATKGMIRRVHQLVIVERCAP